MAGVATLVQRQIARGRTAPGQGAVAAAPSGVRPFTGADATPGALLVKLGTRIWEGAKQRALEQQAARQQQLNEALTMAQIQELVTRHSATKPSYSMNVGGQTFGGLTGAEGARLTMQQNKPPPADKNPRSPVNIGDAAHPVMANLSASELLRFLHDRQAADQFGTAERGRNDRAAAARVLADRLTNQRLTASRTARDFTDSALNANRELSQIPERPTDSEVNVAAYQAADDSLIKYNKDRGSNWGARSRKDLAGDLLPRTRQKLQDDIDARRAPFHEILRLAALGSKNTSMSPEGQATVDALHQLLTQPE